jgi:hypothetical protein
VIYTYLKFVDLIIAHYRGNKRRYQTFSRFLLVSFCVTIVGCNTTRQVQVEGVSGEQKVVSIETFNQEVEGCNVAIKFDEGYEYKTKGVVFAQDSVEYLDSSTGYPKRVGWRDVRFIRKKDHLGGALDGALLALPLAILFSLELGGVGGEVHSTEADRTKGAIISLGIGAVIGVAIGRDYLFEFNNPDD